MHDNYNFHLNKGLSLTGEARDYYAYQRVLILHKILYDLRASYNKILDFGCGDGSTLPIIEKIFRPSEIIGMDIENTLLPNLKKEDGRNFKFALNQNGDQLSRIDLIYTNGVFHHIKPAFHQKNLSLIYSMLSPNGYFAFWENNPFNLGTRLVMSRIPFDKDAQTINPYKAKQMLQDAGFKIITTKFAFIFPKILKKLRPVEKHLENFPIGGQYLILAMKN